MENQGARMRPSQLGHPRLPAETSLERVQAGMEMNGFCHEDPSAAEVDSKYIRGTRSPPGAGGDLIIQQHPLSSPDSSPGNENCLSLRRDPRDPKERELIEAHNRAFESTLFMNQDDEGITEHINIRDDIGLSDQQLIEIPTKQLNKLLKSKGVTKSRSKTIKQERRTLKNRGYAANCRVKREDEEAELEDEIKRLDREIQELDTQWEFEHAAIQASNLVTDEEKAYNHRHYVKDRQLRPSAAARGAPQEYERQTCLQELIN